MAEHEAHGLLRSVQGEEDDVRVEKPWGWYLDIERTPARVTKILCINPGHGISLQRHRFRDERWLALEGSGTAVIDGGEFSVARGQPGLVVRANMVHRLSVPMESRVPLVLYEIQEAAHGGTCDEDDIERLEDDYGRAS